MIYQDAAISAKLNNPAATLGHISISPNNKAVQLQELEAEESLQLFWAASFAATALFETLGAQGSNIVVHEHEEIQLDVYARSQEDNLGVDWQPNPDQQASIEQAAKKVSEAFWYIGKEQPKDSKQPQEPAKQETIVNTDDQRIQHLQRRY